MSKKTNTPEFNEDEYTKAVDRLAEQLAAMVLEDEGDDAMLDDYIADAVDDIRRSATKYFE